MYALVFVALDAFKSGSPVLQSVCEVAAEGAISLRAESQLPFNEAIIVAKLIASKCGGSIRPHAFGPVLPVLEVSIACSTEIRGRVYKALPLRQVIPVLHPYIWVRSMSKTKSSHIVKPLGHPVIPLLKLSLVQIAKACKWSFGIQTTFGHPVVPLLKIWTVEHAEIVTTGWNGVSPLGEPFVPVLERGRRQLPNVPMTATEVTLGLPVFPGLKVVCSREVVTKEVGPGCLVSCVQTPARTDETEGKGYPTPAPGHCWVLENPGPEKRKERI